MVIHLPPGNEKRKIIISIGNKISLLQVFTYLYNVQEVEIVKEIVENSGRCIEGNYYFILNGSAIDFKTVKTIFVKDDDELYIFSPFVGG